MYRALLLVCFIFAAEGRHKWPSGVSDSAAEAAKEIRHLVSDVDSKIQQFCRMNTERPMKGEHCKRHYKLKVDLSGCNENKIEVRASQHIASVQVYDSKCHYKALQLLPEVVDGTEGFWRSRNGLLTVYFPYTKDESQCGRDVHSTVFSLSKLDSYAETPDKFVTFGQRRTTHSGFF